MSRPIRCLALLSAACGGGGEGPDDVEGPADPPFPPPAIAFTDVTAEAGLPDGGFQCLVFDDLDGDGRPDLLIAAPPGAGPERLAAYRNAGDGSFARVAVPLPHAGDALSCDAGDWSGDGVADLIVGHAPPALSALRGLGDLGFADETTRLPAPPDQGPDVFGVSVAALLDLDGDRRLDLLAGLVAVALPSGPCTQTPDDFTCPGEPPGWTPTFLYRNQGERFVPLPSAPGDPAALAVNAAALLDWDGDGRTDVFLTLDFAANQVLRNLDGAGGFADLAPDLGLARYNHGMGVAIGDFDLDGRTDAYVADVGPDQFWFGDEAGGFADRAAELTIAQWTRFHSGWSPVAADFNHDGFLDLFVVNSALVHREVDLQAVARGATPAVMGQADFLYTNNQRGGFSRRAMDHAPGSLPSVVGGASALADYDGDGDLDLAEFYLAPARFRLWRNDTTDAGHYLIVAAGGADGCAGATVRVEAGARAWQRPCGGNTGSAGKSWRPAHFGLGARTRVDRVEVRWPGGDRTAVPGPIAADQVLVVTR